MTFEEAEGEGEEAGYEEAEAGILVQRLEADGSTTDLQLRGDLTYVRDLAAALISEGNCVEVLILPPGSGSGEDVSEAALDGAQRGDAVELALP